MNSAYSKNDLADYLENDWVLEEIKKCPLDDVFISQKWLKEIPAKRMIYADIYKEFLSSRGLKVLDIAGGFCGLSRKLLANHDYTLVDIMTAGCGERLRTIEKEIGKNFWRNKDWAEFEPKDYYDVIIANDIFPNVDQRLGQFLRKFKNRAKRIIVTVTTHDQQSKLADFAEKAMTYVYNKIKRVNGDKIVFIRCPGTDQTNSILKDFFGSEFPKLDRRAQSLFENGRFVYKLEIK